MNWRTAIVAGVLVLLVASTVTAGIVSAKARGKPALSLHLPENDLAPGEDSTLEVALQNEGEVAYASSSTERSRVTTARGVELTIEAGEAPIEVETGTKALGNVPEGVSAAVPFEVTVADDAEPGAYTLPVEVEYTHTEVIGREGAYGQREETLRTSVTVVVEEDASFEVVSASAEDLYGTNGPVAVTIENTGTSTARAASVALESGTAQLTVGGDRSASTFVGDWSPGETRTVSLEGALAAGANRRSYPLTATVSYEDADGEASESEPLSAGVTPHVSSRFTVEGVESTLRVGEEGQITGSLVNEGRSVARNAVLVLMTDTQTIEPIEREYAVGDLAAGASADFGFDVEVSEAAATGPRQFDLVVRYRDRNDDVVESAPLDARVDVGESQDVFDVSPVGARIEAGSSGELRVEVTNRGSEPVTDVSAKLFADGPISADDDEAFVGRLEPGETATLHFGVSAGGGALAKPYPVTLDFQYDDVDGDTLLSDTHQVPVQVTQSESNGPSPLLLVGVAGLVLVALGIVWKRGWFGIRDP